ncbi:hypothetical protein [Phenylobacterium sp.]|uniref:terminase small subunit-like protein n=1 Tax=Phenylobacterium sp. TaxID=1871053 RepID=UPI0027361558|nr:hypothetical protein [Phenylobacterium sp.]MDP3853868.1 hypothetical protein [Phenylobacterium sp.]
MTSDVAVPRPWRAYSDALASVVCARLAGGESLMAVCREPDMPSRAGVKGWAKARPQFRARLAQAMAAGRGNPRGGRRTLYCPPVAELICARVARGMTVGQACDLPGLPHEDTVYGWLKRHPEFAQAYGVARMAQAHRRFDQVWEEAQGATPETAYLARVRIDALKWQAGKLAPTRYGPKPLVEGDGAVVEDNRTILNITVRNFGDTYGDGPEGPGALAVR